MRAFYLAESGLAYGLFYDLNSDSGMVNVDTIAALNAYSWSDAVTNYDSIAFYLSHPEYPPEFDIDYDGAYMTIWSTGRWQSQTVTITAQFGRSFPDSINESALIIDGVAPDFAQEQIIGSILAKTNPKSLPDIRLLGGDFTIKDWLNNYGGTKSDFYTSQLNDLLSREGGETGNGYYSLDRPPVFNDEVLFFPLGDIYIDNYTPERLDIKGPAVIGAHGDVYLRGEVFLDNIKIFAGRNIYFEDSITSRNLVIYAGKNIYIRGRCYLGLQAAAEENIIMEGTSQTSPSSVLLSIGLTKTPTGPPTNKNPPPAYGLHLRNEAIARGVLVAAGLNGTLMLNHETNIVEGIGIARKEAWITGRVNGLIITSRLRCSQDTSENCLGPGKINRSRMPSQAAIPLDFGPQDKTGWPHKLVSWREERD